MILISASLVALLSFYSWVLVDPNFTLFNNQLWATFREFMVHIGYYQRSYSWYCYLAVIVSVWIVYIIHLIKKTDINIMKYVCIIAFLTLFSYPFLSHDFFNYLFDAKILTYYHLNPYTHKALDFPSDPWLRFMHWTHRTYPYGPSFLLISLIPSFFSFGKLILNFFLFKTLFTAAYIHTTYLLNKMNTLWSLIYALNPLVIIEGLINNHNDLLGVWLGIWAIYALQNNKKVQAGILALFSGGIKYLTVPLLGLLIPSKKYARMIAAAGIMWLVTYLSVKYEFQPWYLLNVLVLIPFYPTIIVHLSPFFLMSLLSYYPTIALDGWGNPNNVILKHTIIIVGIIIQSIYFIGYYLHKKRTI